MSAKFSIGLDYGTNSVRALVVNASNGEEVAVAIWDYAHGEQGVILSSDPNLARQHPVDYVTGGEIVLKKALAHAKRKIRGFTSEQIIGLGVDTTGSTPLPVDAKGEPLALQSRFAKNPAAMAWLWKDHMSIAEAAEITTLPANCDRIIWQNAAAPTAANGFSAGFCIACVRAPTCSTGPIRGLNWPIKPKARSHAVYCELYNLYRELHDAFGTREWRGNLHGVMKKLLEIRNRARS